MLPDRLVGLTKVLGLVGSTEVMGLAVLMDKKAHCVPLGHTACRQQPLAKEPTPFQSKGPHMLDVLLLVFAGAASRVVVAALAEELALLLAMKVGRERCSSASERRYRTQVQLQLPAGRVQPRSRPTAGAPMPLRLVNIATCRQKPRRKDKLASSPHLLLWGQHPGVLRQLGKQPSGRRLL